MTTTVLRRSRAQKPAVNISKPLSERLVKEGVTKLTLAELVSIILEMAPNQKANASRLAGEYGEKWLGGLRDANKASIEIGIPLPQACQLVAACELGRRFSVRPGTRSVILRNAKDVSNYVHDMHRLFRECLRVIYINNRHRIVHDEVVSLGTADANLTDPKEIFRAAIQFEACAIILVHNHPSGDVTPSPADIEVTSQVVAAGKLIGVAVVDHVIVANGKFCSVPVKYEDGVPEITRTS